MEYLFSVVGLLQNTSLCPNSFGSVDSALASALNGPWFDSGQGHVPWFAGTSPEVGVQETADRCFSLIDVSNSLSLSLPFCKKSIIYFLKNTYFMWLNLIITS